VVGSKRDGEGGGVVYTDVRNGLVAGGLSLRTELSVYGSAAPSRLDVLIPLAFITRALLALLAIV
jgi:hypothetical protein